MENKNANESQSNAPLRGNSREFEEIELPYDGVTDRNVGIGRRLEDSAEYMTSGSGVTGGDIDANQYQAEVAGEEAVGGTTPTPDQNVTEDLEKAVGLEMDDRAFLRTNEILEQRDDQRWELDPTSSEDYQERRD
jgi:hypothetical protein